MYYYIFKATSNDGKIIKEYIYNEGVTKNFSKDVMMTLVKEFIKKDLEKEGLNYKDFSFTKRLQHYKNFRDRYKHMKFINNRISAEIDEIPEDMKQSDEKKEAGQKRMKNIMDAKKHGTPRLPTSPYGAWASPKDQNSKF